jgi:endonuclease/exonuclease/phosphatase family metal-dependent hydrolase
LIEKEKCMKPESGYGWKVAGALSRAGRVAALLVSAAVAGCGAGERPGTEGAADRPQPVELRVMSFNIEYGGDLIDFDKAIEAIHAAGADVVGVQEAWGHIPQLVERLGWPYYDTRVPIVSRYPLLDPPGAEGAYMLVELRPGEVVAMGTVHLPSDPYGPTEVDNGKGAEEVLALERLLRLPKIERSLEALATQLERGIPVFLTGDFNSPSHRDWTDEAVGSREHIKYPFEWPVTRAVEEAGLRDSYREIHSDPVAAPGFTWPAARPRVEGWNPEAGDPHGRIDYVFAGGSVTTLDSRIVGEPGGPGVEVDIEPWPTDHRGVVSTFRVTPGPAPVYVAVERRAVMVGEDLRVTFHAPGGEADRIAIVPAGGAAGGIAGAAPDAAATQSIEDGSRDHGRLVFPTTAFAPGVYDAVLTATDGRELARIPFHVQEEGAVPEVTTERRVYSSGEPILVRWRNAPGNCFDWLGIYGAGVEAAEADWFLWRHTDARIAGEMTIDGTAEGSGWPLQPGTYRIDLLPDDSYAVLASDTFNVTR